MSRIRLLVGTRKGAFILTSDGKRKHWTVDGPHFGGWELYHLKGSPADPDRIYASQTSSWFGQVIQQSDDGGKTWNPPGTKPEDLMCEDGMPKGASNMFLYDGSTETGQPLTTHQHYDGTQRPWEFKRVWHLEPSLTDPDTVYAGVEDAAIFKSTDGGKTWKELAGLRGAKGQLWQPGAGGMCLHTILLNTGQPDRIFVAISAAGSFRSDDAGQTWRPTNKGLMSKYELPDPDAEVGHCVHCIAMHPSRPNVLFSRSTGMCFGATMPANRGRRSAATCPATLDSRSSCTPTNRTQSLSFRSKVILNTTRRKASCASIAARSAGTSGRR